MFEELEPVPITAREQVDQRYEKDPRPEKFIATTGVFRNEEGETPVLPCVRRAEERILRSETTKDYTAFTGSAAFAECIETLLFGEGHGRHARTAHTPGGTAALRVAGEFIRLANPAARIWVSAPTWSNHLSVFAAAGLDVQRYPYADDRAHELDFDGMVGVLRKVPAGDAVLWHACCHNPTGLDPTPEQWRALADLAAERGFLSLFDVAFLGYAEGVNEDLAALREYCRPGLEVLIATSLSKSFELYNERVGALTVVGATPEGAATAFRHVRLCIRANYSRPPARGGAIVTTILSDPVLRAEWEGEVRAIRDRVRRMRRRLADGLMAGGVGWDTSHILRERGIFTRLPLAPAQIVSLEERHAIYLHPAGIINVTAMTDAQLDRLCGAVAGLNRESKAGMVSPKAP